MQRFIRLRGLNGPIKGESWESQELLRIGRLDPLEIVLQDSSVSRYHAEVRLTDRGWRARDLGSTNGTRLNGVRLGTGQWPLQERDLLQFGEITLVVEAISETVQEKLPAENMAIEATTCSSWDEAISRIAGDPERALHVGDDLVALLRACHHLVHLTHEEDLLNSVLEDAVKVLDAQRGAIVLHQESEDALKLRAVANGRSEPKSLTGSGSFESNVRFSYSQSLAQRTFATGESILCHSVEDDPDLAMAQSIAEGAMGSVLCILLRTPRKRLGVLHLDRSPWQEPFTQRDLHHADALAAIVSSGIESAALLKKQRNLFLNTISILSQAVELRDEYTGGHTQRVTKYAMMLAERIKLSKQDRELIEIGTPLHDIGKIGIDDAILRKPTRLTNEEFEQMKTHTVKGAEIIRTVPDLLSILPIVRSHHERWDGNGYPDGLAGEDIPRLARIVALADAFDAMTSDRPYRKGMPAEVAFSEIEKGAGRQFDPELAEVFLLLRPQIEAEMSKHRETAPRQDVPCTVQISRVAENAAG